MEKLLKRLQFFDLFLSLGTLAYGVFSHNIWITAFGILGLVLAWFSPASKLQEKMKRYSKNNRRIKAQEAAAKEAVEAVALTEQDVLPVEDFGAAQASEAKPYARMYPGYSSATIHPGPHNLLSVKALNLYEAPGSQQCAVA